MAAWLCANKKNGFSSLAYLTAFIPDTVSFCAPRESAVVNSLLRLREIEVCYASKKSCRRTLSACDFEMSGARLRYFARFLEIEMTATTGSFEK